MKTKKSSGKIKDHIGKKDISCPWIRRVNTTNISVLLKLMYRVKIMPIKIPDAFLEEIDKLILNSYGNARDPE
jgi:hypothetical protein